MKRFLLFLSLYFTLGSASHLSAHSPSDILFTYIPGDKTLTVTVMHNISLFPFKHYIKKVEIFVDGESRIIQLLKKQDDKKSQTLSYIIPDVDLKSKVAIQAECSLMGELKKEINLAQ